MPSQESLTIALYHAARCRTVAGDVIRGWSWRAGEPEDLAELGGCEETRENDEDAPPLSVIEQTGKSTETTHPKASRCGLRLAVVANISCRCHGDRIPIRSTSVGCVRRACSLRKSYAI